MNKKNCFAVLLCNNRGQLGLIALLVVVVIIVYLAYMMVPSYLRSAAPAVDEKSPIPKVDAPIQKQIGGRAECANNLRNIRAAISMQRQFSESPPASLKDMQTSGVSEEISKCPVTNKPYEYDPSRGRVWCTTPGHENY